MLNHFDITKSARVALLSSLATLFLASTPACTTYRGVGEYQSDVNEGESHTIETDAHAKGLPSIVWNGKRKNSETEALNFEWPVADIRMSRGFAYGTRAHWGLDLANPRGTPILAAEQGTVIYTGSGFRGYGKLIVVEHNDEWATLYAHLDKISVKEGQVIQKGERLGAMGRTGRSSGVHLHFEIRHRRQPVNPLAYLPDVQKLATNP
jgi:murein DD-endopeptidase MepM/ murein hydrolase activator NlpD